MASTSGATLAKLPTLNPSNKLAFEKLKQAAENADVKPVSDGLGQAAANGDVEFVKKCVDNNTPHSYYFTLFEEEPIWDHSNGNILHLAVRFNQVKFMEEAMELLPPEVSRQLLLQPRSPRSGVLPNPLHYAAVLGNVKAVKVILGFCVSNASLFDNDHVKPWLQRDADGRSPCIDAVIYNWEECGLEILKMDLEKLSSIVEDTDSIGLLYAAVRGGCEELALTILRSSPSLTYNGLGNLTPLHALPWCSGGQKSQDICRLLIQKVPSLVCTIGDNGYTILHMWAQEGKVWPFECILNCKELYPGDLNRVLVDLMSVKISGFGFNPFHMLVNFAPDEEDAVKIAKILIKAFREVDAAQHGDQLDFPWLSSDNNGTTPLECSLTRRNQKLAQYILSEKKDACMEFKSDNLLFAIRRGCKEVAEVILNSVVKEKWIDLKDDAYFNALHVAPSCNNEEFVQLLIDGNRELVGGISTDGLTILHTWMIIGEVWPYRCILQVSESNLDCKEKLLGLFVKRDTHGRTIFHYSSQKYNENTTTKIIQVLADGYKRLDSSWNSKPLHLLPWFVVDIKGDKPLHLAIEGQHEALALQILSLHEDDNYHKVLDLDKLKCKTLLLAMENKCYQVAKKVLNGLKRQSWTPYLENSSNGQNILHFLHNCTDKEFGKWLATIAPEFITKQDKSGITPLDKASDSGVNWLVREMLSTNPVSIFRVAPLAWVNACKNGHVSIVSTFIDCHPGSFKDHCVGYKMSPLHHIKLPNVRSYEDFLKLPYMMDLINLQDSEGATPLHAAIRIGDIHLTEALLKISDTMYEIMDDNNETARSLLQKKYKNKNWKKMCKEIGYDPNIKINYLQRKTNLLDVRNALFVVAALLATITFTAGFTLPGGLNQDTGEAMLAKKAAFVVFMIADTIALFCSMSVLVCLIWSIVNDSSRSMQLIDQSMNLLMISLVFTVITFMCGVFMVISQKSMWVAIFVIVMCSILATAIIGSMLYQLVKSVIQKDKNNGTGQIGSAV